MNHFTVPVAIAFLLRVCELPGFGPLYATVVLAAYNSRIGTRLKVLRETAKRFDEKRDRAPLGARCDVGSIL